MLRTRRLGMPQFAVLVEARRNASRKRITFRIYHLVNMHGGQNCGDSGLKESYHVVGQVSKELTLSAYSSLIAGISALPVVSIQVPPSNLFVHCVSPQTLPRTQPSCRYTKRGNPSSIFSTRSVSYTKEGWYTMVPPAWHGSTSSTWDISLQIDRQHRIS